MDLLSYTVTTGLIAAAPGPIMATLALRGLAGETSQAIAFACGVILCEIILLGGAMAGALALLDRAPVLLAALGWLGVGYLLWLALDMWRSPHVVPAATGTRGVADLSAGFVICIANPYNATFYLTVLPALGWRIEAMPGLVVAATLGPSLLVYGGTILLARFGRRNLSLQDRPALRRTLAVALAATALWIAFG